MSIYSFSASITLICDHCSGIDVLPVTMSPFSSQMVPVGTNHNCSHCGASQSFFIDVSERYNNPVLTQEVTYPYPEMPQSGFITADGTVVTTTTQTQQVYLALEKAHKETERYNLLQAAKYKKQMQKESSLI